MTRDGQLVVRSGFDEGKWIVPPVVPHVPARFGLARPASRGAEHDTPSGNDQLLADLLIRPADTTRARARTDVRAASSSMADQRLCEPVPPLVGALRVQDGSHLHTSMVSQEGRA